MSFTSPTMGTLSGSSNLDLTKCQLNDVQRDQHFINKTFNNCSIIILSTTSTRRADRSSTLTTLPSAQADGPVILSAPQLSPNQVSLPEGQREQTVSYVRSCECALHRLHNPFISGPPRPLQISNNRLNDPLVHHYLTCVVSIQYLLANTAATVILIYETLQTNGSVYEAVRLLAAVHQDKHRNGQSQALATPGRESHNIYGDLSVDLIYTKQASSTQEDAIAALLVVSSVLFDGGTGSWQPWLQVAYDYLDKEFESHGGAESTLLAHADDKFRFVVKTAFWFDIIASVTRQQKPHYYREIDTLFHPLRTSTSSPLLSMADSIGCHNDIFWALNKTSTFSSEAAPLSRHSPDVEYTMKVLDENAQGHREPATSRSGWSSQQYISHMLCLATIVWLRSLMPGTSSSRCIKRTINEFLRFLRNIPHEERTKRHVVRSSVFSIFICGLFITRREDRQLLEDHLHQQSTDSIGNCTAIITLLKSIWQDHGSASDKGIWFLPSFLTKSLRRLTRYLRCKIGLVSHVEQDPSPLSRARSLLRESCLLLV